MLNNNFNLNILKNKIKELGFFCYDYDKYHNKEIQYINEVQNNIHNSFCFYPSITVIIKNNNKMEHLLELINSFYIKNPTSIKNIIILEELLFESMQINHSINSKEKIRLIKIKPHSGELTALQNDQSKKQEQYNIFMNEFEKFYIFLNNLDR